MSGGPDSVALLRVLCELGQTPRVVWIDHGLRPGASAEGDFVSGLASKLRLPFQALACSPTSPSEGDMREARYAAFETLPADTIATGHTASDQAETVMMRLCRGTGISGLSGIPPRRGRYVRPLLGVKRSEVLAYLEHLDQPYATDPTNASLDPLRNRVRHVLLPQLRDLQPAIVDSLCRLAETARSDRAFLEDAAHAHVAEHGLATGALLTAHPGLRAHVIREVSPVPIGAERMTQILRMIEGRSGPVQLEGGVTCRVEGPRLCFEPTL